MCLGRLPLREYPYIRCLLNFRTLSIPPLKPLSIIVPIEMAGSTRGRRFGRIAGDDAPVVLVRGRGRPRRAQPIEQVQEPVTDNEVVDEEIIMETLAWRLRPGF